MYGGDEVNAVVLDVGTSTTRAGCAEQPSLAMDFRCSPLLHSYAGEDTPKVVIPSSYGHIPARDDLPARHFFGNAGPSVYRPYQSVLNPLRDSTIEDWDAAERLIEHSLKEGLHLQSLEDHPLLVTEPAWNSKENRERMIELAFEGWNTPAYYAADRAVLSRSVTAATQCVVDSTYERTASLRAKVQRLSSMLAKMSRPSRPSTMASCCAKVRSLFLLGRITTSRASTAIQKSPLGGSLLSSLLAAILKSLRAPDHIRPHYLVKSKGPTPPNEPARAVLREDRLASTDSATPTATTAEFARYEEMRVMHDFKESTCHVWEQNNFNDETARTRPGKVFEFPDGFNSEYRQHRFMVPEALFNPSRYLPKEVRLLF